MEFPVRKLERKFACTLCKNTVNRFVDTHPWFATFDLRICEDCVEDMARAMRKSYERQ